jgi:hypothetical protein
MIKLTNQLPKGIQPGQVYTYKDIPPFNTSQQLKEEEDHEVSMAQGLLDDIIKNATELKGKLGDVEKDIPAWIQDHISQSQNFISQANTNYHEYKK